MRNSRRPFFILKPYEILAVASLWPLKITEMSGIFKKIGNRASAVFNSFADANFYLNKAKTDVEKVKRGLMVGIVEGKTFDDLIEIYILCRTALKERPQDDRSVIAGIA